MYLKQLNKMLKIKHKLAAIFKLESSSVKSIILGTKNRNTLNNSEITRIDCKS